MAPETLPGTATNETDIPASGAERADQLIDQEVERAGTVGEVRSSISIVLIEVRGDDEAEGRIDEYKASLDEAAAGHDGVQLEEMNGGLQGLNQVGTHNSRVNDDLLTAEQLTSDAETAEEVLDHEDSEETGHAGQEVREGLVMEDGETLEGTEMLEGEVEAQQGQDKRGSADAAREGQPAETYGSGQRKVAPHLEAISGYVREGAGRVETQATILQKSGKSRQEMVVILQRSGIYSREEIGKVVQMAA